jgi:hypothetical protein
MMDSICLHVTSEDDEVRRHREEIARCVFEHFTPKLLSRARVICYLDDRDIDWLKQMWGGLSNRGVHWPIRGQGLNDWPQDMWDIIAGVDADSGEVSWPYASVIYLHGSTCNSDIQLAMTLAHELQHFVQFTTEQNLWAKNTLLQNLPNLPRHNLRHWFDLPVEVEARVTAKRVTEKLFGHEAVCLHIAKMIAARSSEEDAADWEFIKGLDPNWSYDIHHETAVLVEEYWDELEILKRTICAQDRELGTVDLEF